MASNDIASLIVAVSDLKAVQSVIAAIRAADVASGGVVGPMGIIEKPPFGRGFTLTPTPRIEPRRVLHPTPRIEPRDTVHLTSRIDLGGPVLKKAPMPEPANPEKPCHHSTSPIQPPWKVLPWQTPVPLRPKVKLIIRQADFVGKGMLIDLFI